MRIKIKVKNFKNLPCRSLDSYQPDLVRYTIYHRKAYVHVKQTLYSTSPKLHTELNPIQQNANSKFLKNWKFQVNLLQYLIFF